MRALLFILVALAVGKVATLAYIRQNSKADAIVAAYREQAVAQCHALLSPPQPRGVERIPRRRDKDYDVELEIGDESLNVRLWQTSHPKWSERYEDPYLIVTRRSEATDGATTVRRCAYNINRRTARAEGSETDVGELAPPGRQSNTRS